MHETSMKLALGLALVLVSVSGLNDWNVTHGWPACGERESEPFGFL